MKRLTTLLIALIVIGFATGCGNRENGYGAGGGQSLREGSTAPYHSPIAQDETYQTVLGLNILLYPAPVDEASFDAYGSAHWELDPADFTTMMRNNFNGEMGARATYEPVVDALSEHPLIQEIQDTIYGGEAVQVGWTFGNNGSLDALQYNGVKVTLVTAEDAVIFVGSKDKFDEAAGSYNTKDTKAYYVPTNAVVELKPESLYSMPVRVIKSTGQLTAIIVPAGVGLEPASPGSGFDQGLVANDLWIFGLPDSSDYQGLTGGNIAIEAADTSARYED
jgi:hypothetical protein